MGVHSHDEEQQVDTLEVGQYYDLIPQSSPPDHRNGRIALADGANWDPSGDGAAEVVISNGSAWQQIHGFGGTL